MVEVTESDRAILTSWAHSASIRAGLAQRARIVLLAAEGAGTSEIVLRTGASKPTVIAWTRRYAAEGLAGLDDRHRPGRPRTADDVAIVLATLAPPPARLGARRWSSRLLAGQMGVSNVKVASVWREFGLRPWRREDLTFGTDPALPAAICGVLAMSLPAPVRAIAVRLGREAAPHAASTAARAADALPGALSGAVSASRSADNRPGPARPAAASGTATMSPGASL